MGRLLESYLMVVRYADVEGRDRQLTAIGPGFVVCWLKGGSPYSTTTRYWAEDGQVIQIPDDAWEKLGITKEEEEQND